MKKVIKITLEYGLLIILACIFIFPLIWMIVSSLKPEESIYKDMSSIFALLPSFELSDWYQNYKELLSRFDAIRYLLNSIFYTGITTIASIVVNAMAGFAFAKFRFTGKRFLFGFLISLLIIPLEIIVITQFTVAEGLGILNTRIAVILPMIANMLFIYLFRNFFMAVPDEVIESVKLDGGNYWHIFWKIVLPMSKPGIATVGVLTFINSWNDYLWPLMVLTDKSKFPLQVAITNINSTEPVYTNQVMGILTIATIPVIIIYIVAQKYFQQGLGGAGTGIK